MLRWPTPRAVRSIYGNTGVQENNEIRLRQRMDQLSAAVAAPPSALLVTSTQTLPPPAVNAQPMGGEYQGPGLPASVYEPIPAAVYQSAAIVHPSEVSVELVHNNLSRAAGAGGGAQVRRSVRSGSGRGSKASGRQGVRRMRPASRLARRRLRTGRDRFQAFQPPGTAKAAESVRTTIDGDGDGCRVAIMAATGWT